jgi:hypothetical protein
MIGSTRSRRLGVLLGGVALVIIVAGCTVGTTTIPAGQASALVECNAGPTPGKYWVAGPGAVEVRFQVLSSDATEPLAAIVGTGAGWPGLGSFGTVWDGTKSTGPKQWAGDWNGSISLVYGDWSPVAQTSNTKWAFTALDANGKDVGFTCTG